MSDPIRPGARGGRDQFNWDNVKEDRQRSNYLGSSIHGIPDKFKQGVDTYWYAKNSKISGPDEHQNELEDIKAKEKQMMETLIRGGDMTKNNNSYSYESGRHERTRKVSSIPTNKYDDRDKTRSRSREPRRTNSLHNDTYSRDSEMNTDPIRHRNRKDAYDVSKGRENNYRYSHRESDSPLRQNGSDISRYAQNRNIDFRTPPRRSIRDDHSEYSRRHSPRDGKRRERNN